MGRIGLVIIAVRIHHQVFPVEHRRGLVAQHRKGPLLLHRAHALLALLVQVIQVKLIELRLHSAAVELEPIPAALHSADLLIGHIILLPGHSFIGLHILAEPVQTVVKAFRLGGSPIYPWGNRLQLGRLLHLPSAGRKWKSNNRRASQR